MAEIPYRLSADLNNLFHINRIFAALAGTEGDRMKGNPLSIVDPQDGKHNVGQIKIFRNFVNIAGQRLTAHEPVGSVGIGNIQMEDQAQDKTQSLCHENARQAVLTMVPVSNLDAVLPSPSPEGGKFRSQCLAVRVRLKDVICAALEGIPVAVENGGA